jgi:hypothetical protein
MNTIITTGSISMTNWQSNKKASKPTEKVCTKCPEKGIQPIANFSKNPRMVDGHSSDCKACQKKYRDDRKRRKQQENELYGIV